jgi:hypothetical protein
MPEPVFEEAAAREVRRINFMDSVLLEVTTGLDARAASNELVYLVTKLAKPIAEFTGVSFIMNPDGEEVVDNKRIRSKQNNP